MAASRRPFMRHRLLSRLLTAGFLVSPIPLCDVLAQEAPRKSEIRGVVLRSEDRAPVINARVSLEGAGHEVRTDKNGRFKFPKVTAGEYLVRAEIVGHPAATTTVTVAIDDRLEMEFLIGPAEEGQPLPEIEVTADADEISPIAVFNRRAKEGNGRYFTRADIEKRKPATLMDLVRGVPGVRVSCTRNLHTCVLRFRRFLCDPGYFLNGLPADASVLFLTVPTDVEGVEIYTGPSETPIELEGIRSSCGAVAIWTRIGQRTLKP